MKNKNIILGISALALTASALFFTQQVSAYQGDYTQKGPNCDEERHEAITSAFENNDYNAWKEQMQDKGRVAQVINEDNFAKFAQAHRLAQEGNYDEADAIRQELGLRTRNGEKVGAGFRQSKMQGSGQGMGMNR